MSRPPQLMFEKQLPPPRSTSTESGCYNGKEQKHDQIQKIGAALAAFQNAEMFPDLSPQSEPRGDLHEEQQSPKLAHQVR
jgi:hypothetical protein